MSVPKGKRGESYMEFFYNAYKMNDAITFFLLKDFGTKSHVRDLKTFTYNAKMEAEDTESFKKLCLKYDIDVESSYPLYLLEFYRNSILNLLANIIFDITQANTIYPTSEYDFNIRRQFQWKAIGGCYQLLQMMQTVIRIFQPKDKEKFMPYVDLITKEIELLKKWKKNDNKILRAIKSREQQAYITQQLAIHGSNNQNSSNTTTAVCPVEFIKENNKG